MRTDNLASPCELGNGSGLPSEPSQVRGIRGGRPNIEAEHVSGLSPGKRTAGLGILHRLRVDECIKSSHQELRRMSARETLRTTLLSLLEEEMGEKYPVLEDDQDLRESLGLDSVDVVGLVMRIGARISGSART